jgi:flap endonuclease-1
MGVQISDIIPRKEISIRDLGGKTIAVDALNTLYQFLTTIRQSDGTSLMDTKGNITSHLSGLFYRNINLLMENVRVIYVFDGVPPELKFKEIQKRRAAKENAEEKYEKAKQEDNVDDMKKYSQQFVRIDKNVLEESKQLLDAMGIPFIEATGEGEAEAAQLTKNEKVWASASQDYDSLLYGANKLIRNLTLSRRRKTSSGEYVEVSIEMIELESVINKLQINQDQLICLGILVGTDLNPGGVRGIGQKTALDIVKEQEYPIKIFEYIANHERFELDFDWQEIYREFKEYTPVENPEMKFKKVDEDKVREILMSRDFSENRIDSGLKRLREAKEKAQQQTLF